MSRQTLFCLIFSSAGAGLAQKLARAWRDAPLRLLAPASLLRRNADLNGIEAMPGSLAQCMPEIWARARGIIFVGAAGIAIRAIAPLLVHKSQDAAVICVDPAGKFAISLLSGHLGGGNALARTVARVIGATPVITTATDCANAPALDLLIQAAGGIIQDWRELPGIQAALLEGKTVCACDPWHVLPELPPITPVNVLDGAGIWVSPFDMPPAPGRLGVCAPLAHIGLGMRAGIAAAELASAFGQMLAECRIATAGVAALATVDAKSGEPALLELAENRHLPIRSWPARILAQIATPNPSAACAKRFGTAPFSVCEAAALLSAGEGGSLFQPKIRIGRAMTFAVALPKTFSPWEK